MSQRLVRVHLADVPLARRMEAYHDVKWHLDKYERMNLFGEVLFPTKTFYVSAAAARRVLGEEFAEVA